MQLNVTSKTDEALMGRTYVKATVEFDASTPSYKDLSTAIAHNLKADEKLVVIRHVYTSFGSKKADISAYLYKDEAKKKFMEPKVKVKKGTGAEAAPEKK